jgi:3-phosphoglycerate kinase
VHGKRVVVRADYNVPLGHDGSIASDFRIVQSLPTLQYLLERGCTVFVIAHLGRPESQPSKELSLAQVAKRLQALLPDYPVTFVDSLIDDKARQACKHAKPGTVTILENLRFNKGEEENSADFASQIQKNVRADYFVQDGFGVVHRAHTSTDALTHTIPSVAGLLLEKEVTTLESAMNRPIHPVLAIVGGAKISDKVGFIERLLDIADTVLVGGAMANTFLKHQGYDIGASVYETGQDEKIATILQKAKPNQIVLPIDVTTSTEIAKDSQKNIRQLADVHHNELILDIGPKTIELFSGHIKKAATVLWNGTLGYAELPQFAEGTAAVAKELSLLENAETIVGGGDTVDYVLDWLDRSTKQYPHAHFSHISTGGGASLELMSGMKLPGVEALLSK